MPKERKLRSYHFDCGNSNTGTVGFCARVWAHTREEAASMLAEALPESVEVEGYGGLPRPGVEYISVYFGHDNVTVEHIDTIDEVKDAGPKG
jgi:hypothetical protein